MKFFAKPVTNDASKNADQLDQPNIDSTVNQSARAAKKSRSISCQTVFREQSAQTKPYFPPIQYHAGVERTDILPIDNIGSMDSAPGLNETKAINRRRKRLECWNILRQCDKTIEEKRHVLEAFGWEEWLAEEDSIEDTQLLRLRMVEQMLEQRDRLFEMDAIKTIDESINRFNKQHKIKTSNIKYVTRLDDFINQNGALFR